MHLLSILLTKPVAEHLFNIPTGIERLGLVFQIPDSSPLWTRMSIIGVYIIGPFFVFIAGLLSFIYLVRKNLRGRTFFKLFVIWVFVISVNMVLGGLSVGIPLVKGFGYVPWWMGFPKGLLYVMAGIAFVLLALSGFLLNMQLAAFGFSNLHRTNARAQFKFKFFAFVLPALVFGLLCAGIGLPNGELYYRGLGVLLPLQMIGILNYRFVPVRPRRDNPLISLFRKEGEQA